jgi:glycosyltransferase involved in cell wall biosynthesis
MASVVLEALSYGLPAITLNHQGCASIISDDATVKMPVTTPAETIRALAVAIASISEHPDGLSQLSKRPLAAAEGFSWPTRAAAMTRVYKDAMTFRI